MLTFLAKRLLQLIPTLFFVSVLIFSLQQLLPGDPAMIMAGEDRDPAVIEQIRKQYRLDQPIPVQYVFWVKGRALRRPRRVDAQQAEGARPRAAEAARHHAARLDGDRDRADDRHHGRHRVGGEEGHRLGLCGEHFSLWGLSTPNFWLGIMLIFLFSVQLGWLPPRATCR
jgi:peptide/nickel transport system permease protein